ncbi:hypothetical protein DFQ12_5610 [Sphingobacterium detergens]|uniref:Uncharacterized protein n=1 Tax=Sphingobacterium detergens TaxID=1145106 RepID=A0A420AE87_SPHD1|nr:hypothetical protein DFQ12_5610 [Sphingobacterium detergens]
MKNVIIFNNLATTSFRRSASFSKNQYTFRKSYTPLQHHPITIQLTLSSSKQ